jgi:hypothetical protein
MGMQVIRMALVAGLTVVGLTAFSPTASADPTKGMAPARETSHAAAPMGARHSAGEHSTPHKSSGSIMKTMYHQVAAHH